ncbi:MAG: Dihydrodipicolinate reductase [Bacilli bacterium]|nr:Dihydrodipicolinate reductase [Bacilli bacterium]
MKIGLIGFGRAGKAVAEEILKDDKLTLEWVLKQSPENTGNYASHLLGYELDQGKIYAIQEVDHDSFFKTNLVDVLIDFSSPSSISSYFAAAKHGIRIVSAISNYEPEHHFKLKRLGKQTAILHAPNITLGINFLISMAKALQAIVPEADIEIVEEHFRGKKDVSGTALRIANKLGLDETKHVNSIRVGGIVGKHEIIFGLANQTIRLVHESIDRTSFGQGALFAAHWLKNKQCGLYTMEDALSINGNGENNVLYPSSAPHYTL